MNCTDVELELLRHNQCPDCHNFGFHHGPRGGASQMIFCCNPHCRSGFLVAPRHNIAFARRTKPGDEAYYPPRVHILLGGFALCNFSGSFKMDGDPMRLLPVFPYDWPIGHSWVGLDDLDDATCPACRKLSSKREAQA